MTNSELILMAGGILLALFLLAAKQNAAFALVVIAIVGYTAYCAYWYRGAKNWTHAGIAIGIFVFFIATSGIDSSLSNVMMFAWLISAIYYAYNAQIV